MCERTIFELYGFASQAELSSFKMLISVSGVGPKAALAILSSGTPDQLALSIVTGDEKALTGVPGIGKKIAQRIILELKDKLAKEQGSFDTSGLALLSPVSTGGKTQEAASALAVLGYCLAKRFPLPSRVWTTALPVEKIIRHCPEKAGALMARRTEANRSVSIDFGNDIFDDSLVSTTLSAGG